MLQALGAIGGCALVMLGVRSFIIMAKEEFQVSQQIFESGYQKRQRENELQTTNDDCDLESGGGGGIEPYEDYEHQDARPESPQPSVPSPHSPRQHVVRVPPPGASFPPPPPRSPRSSDSYNSHTETTPVAEPMESVEGVQPADSPPYIDFVTHGPEVEHPIQQSDLSKFVVVHPPAPAPAHVGDE